MPGKQFNPAARDRQPGIVLNRNGKDGPLSP